MQWIAFTKRLYHRMQAVVNLFVAASALPPRPAFWDTTVTYHALYFDTVSAASSFSLLG